MIYRVCDAEDLEDLPTDRRIHAVLQPIALANMRNIVCHPEKGRKGKLSARIGKVFLNSSSEYVQNWNT